jgi:hypothetical protein
MASHPKDKYSKSSVVQGIWKQSSACHLEVQYCKLSESKQQQFIWKISTKVILTLRHPEVNYSKSFGSSVWQVIQ